MFKGIGGTHLGLPPFPSEHACRRERTENEGKIKKNKVNNLWEGHRSFAKIHK
jgi:hypothetical protein